VGQIGPACQPSQPAVRAYGGVPKSQRHRVTWRSGGRRQGHWMNLVRVGITAAHQSFRSAAQLSSERRAQTHHLFQMGDMPLRKGQSLRGVRAVDYFPPRAYACFVSLAASGRLPHSILPEGLGLAFWLYVSVLVLPPLPSRPSRKALIQLLACKGRRFSILRKPSYLKPPHGVSEQ
jgi:hypothetical protein